MSKHEAEGAPMFMLLSPGLQAEREAVVRRLGRTDASHLRRIAARLASKPG